MNNKFKKVVATGLAVTSLVTAGTVVAKGHNKNNSPSESPRKNVTTVTTLGSKDNDYTIKVGDTLYEIADRYYGDSEYYDEIAEYNNIEDANKIKAGDTIKLPNKLAPNVEYMGSVVKSYTISSGDSLISICEKFYNDNNYETALRLAKYNNIENPDLIKLGQTIEIPPYEGLQLINPYPYDYEADNGIKR